MTEYERGYRDGLKSASQLCDAAHDNHLKTGDASAAMAVSVLQEHINALSPRIDAPEDEALVEVMCNAVESVSYDVGGASCGDMETAMRAVLVALRKVGEIQ